MWVKWKVWWQDGLYKYNPGKITLLPVDLARRYCESGKAEKCNPPKWASAEVVSTKRKIPSARSRIKTISTVAKQQVSDYDAASEVMRDED